MKRQYKQRIALERSFLIWSFVDPKNFVEFTFNKLEN